MEKATSSSNQSPSPSSGGSFLLCSTNVTTSWLLSALAGTPNLTLDNLFKRAGVNFTAKAERTRIAFYSVYYNTRTDDMSSLCGPVVDDVRVWFTSASTRFRLPKALSAFVMVSALVLALV